MEEAALNNPVVPSPVVAPTPAVSEPVAEYYAAPVAPEPPAAPVAPEPPVVPLSRRDRRLLEQGATLPVDTVPTEAVAAPPPVAEPSVALPPVFADRRRAQVSEVSQTRVVGDFGTATSSLIIPETPTIDIAGPLGDTGEVVVTGQILLPSAMSERGSIPVLADHRDDDDVVDAYVTGAIPASAKPVRASQAVSGKGDDSDIVLVRRARWGTAAVVTSLGAAVLGLAAVALLILALMTDVLG